MVSHGPRSSPAELNSSNHHLLRERKSSAPAHSSQPTLFTFDSPANHVQTTLSASAPQDYLFLHQCMSRKSENTRYSRRSMGKHRGKPCNISNDIPPSELYPEGALAVGYSTGILGGLLPALPLTGYVILGKSFNLPVYQFSIWKKDIHNSSSHRCVCVDKCINICEMPQ